MATFAPPAPATASASPDHRLGHHAAAFASAKQQMLIDGKFVSAASGKTFPIFNPATGDVICEVPEAELADVDLAVHAARRAFDAGPWATMAPSARGQLIWKLADLLEAHTDEFAELEALDNGKPVSVARVADVPLAVDLFRYMAGWATKTMGTTIPLSAGHDFLSYTVARARRRRRPDHPLELPAPDGRVEARPRARHRLHRRHEARGADARSPG